MAGSSIQLELHAELEWETLIAFGSDEGKSLALGLSPHIQQLPTIFGCINYDSTDLYLRPLKIRSQRDKSKSKSLTSLQSIYL